MHALASIAPIGPRKLRQSAIQEGMRQGEWVDKRQFFQISRCPYMRNDKSTFRDDRNIVEKLF